MLFNHRMPAGRHFVSTQTADEFVCANDHRVVRTLQAGTPLKFVAATWFVLGREELHAVV